MIAELQVTFGGDPMGWLSMPLAVLGAYMAAAPIVRARDALSGASQVAVGSGTMDRGEAREWVRAHEAQASRSRSVRPISEDHRQALIAGAGITVG